MKRKRDEPEGKDDVHHLMEAMEDENFSRVQELLENNGFNYLSNVASQMDGMTPLHWACDHGHLQTATLMIDNGSDIDTRDTAGAIPFHLAYYDNDLDMMKLLLKHGADINANHDEYGKNPSITLGMRITFIGNGPVSSRAWC